MLNISKCRKLIINCSAFAAIVTIGSVQIAQAQTTPPPGGTTSNASSTNVTTTTGGGPGIPAGGSSSPSPSPAISSRASTISSRISVAQASYDTTVSNLAAAETVQPVAADTTPVRFSVDKGVADLASCGCPNADTVGSAPTTTAPSPALLAAKTAEADAAAELAAAQAEARQFIESVKSGNTATSSTVVSQLW